MENEHFIKQQEVLDCLGEKYKALLDQGLPCILENEDETCLLELAEDKDKIIRAGAVDLLGCSNRESTRDYLLKKAKTEPSVIVRSYCGPALCDIAYERDEDDVVIRALRSLFEREKNLHVKLAWLGDLLPFLEDEEIEKYKKMIEKGLRSRNRHHRYLAIKAMNEDDRMMQLIDLEELMRLEQKEPFKYIRIELRETIQRRVTRGRGDG